MMATIEHTETRVLRFTNNERGRDFVVGDLHGMYEALKALLEKVRFNCDTDRLFGVGDLVDRGPNPLDCLALLNNPDISFNSVRGNHEDMAINYNHAKDFDPMRAIMMADGYLQNGGAWFLTLDRDEQRRIASALAELPYAIEIKVGEQTVGLVHAEVPGDDWNFFTLWMEGANNDAVGWDHVDHYALWGRTIVRERAGSFRGVSGIDKVYVGHTPLKNTTNIHNVHYIDTGACFGKKLSMVCLQTNEVFEQDCSHDA